MKEFRKTLLLAHEKAFADVQLQKSNPALPPVAGNQGADKSEHEGPGCNVVSSENATNLPKPVGAVANSQASCESPQVKLMASSVAVHEMTTSLHGPRDQLLWTCSTCADAKFTSKFFSAH